MVVVGNWVYWVDKEVPISAAPEPPVEQESVGELETVEILQPPQAFEDLRPRLAVLACEMAARMEEALVVAEELEEFRLYVSVLLGDEL